ncbi:ABC transporter ATP-binding protein [Rhodoligotrophos ferricapiens]|uniref:ABC transporter ATP-binding protein n=1 Tax=Rhodoligotrophos ferricapiens TaxID=3069264 RepID=UPI00315D1560
MSRARNGEDLPAVKLAVKDIYKRFGNFVALAGPAVDLRAGEFLTLLGPSGSGKTTLLLTIAGLVKPDDGEIRIDGEPATYLPPHMRDIGMVFQNYALFPHLTVFENIAFPLQMRRRSSSEIKTAVNRVLEVIRLPELGDRYPRELSGGQQQRVALARALVYEPSIVLMDEPLGALDKKLREQLQLEIKRLHRELRLSVLYVTHDQEEALVMSDRICLMREGRIEQIGTPDELYFRPRSLFTADFLGESNLLPGRLIGRNGTYGEVELDGGCRAEGTLSDKGLSPGDSVRLMIRPEALRLSAGENDRNMLRVHFREAVLSGSTSKWFFCGPADQVVIAHVLTDCNGTQPGQGAEMTLSWRREACVVLRDG